MDAMVRRQKTLELIGVQSWYGRFNLSNAQQTPSHLFVVEKDPVGTAHSDSLDEVKSLQKELSVVSLPSIRAETKETPETIESSNEILEQESSHHEEVVLDRRLSNLSFVMHAFKFGSMLIVLECGKGLNLASESSFLEMAMRVWQSQNLELTKSGDVFSWPVFDGEALSVNQQLEFERIAHSWFSPLRADDVTTVIYFGSNDMLWRNIIEDVCGQSTSKIEICTFSTTLSSILSSPLRKAEVWDFLCKIGELP